ncbi:hypothetical protein [Pedobacter sp. N23S346]|uniref:hypothetical protein n=1 Tax=Pedobacter sp. N23S346 TaxID=3402750 RepID=UPI003AD3CF91
MPQELQDRRGLFTIQPSPNEELTFVKDKNLPDEIERIEFDQSAAAHIQGQLFKMGIREDMLFPTSTVTPTTV